MCDNCDAWCHISCVGISASSYSVLNRFSSFSWICCKCNSINAELSSSLLDADFTSPKRYSALHDDASEVDVASGPQASTPTDKAPPLQFSSPRKNRRKALKAVIINCNGLKSFTKQSQFQALIDHHRPDIILGCESKLDDTCPTYSVFPSSYNVFRQGRNEHGGGVFVAVHNSLIVSNCPEFDTECELVWCHLQFTNAKPLFIASYYRPPSGREQHS